MHIFSSRFLIEFNDNSFEIMKSEIDIDRLLFEKSFYTRCFDSLGTRQIDQMNGCDCFDIASWLGTLDVDDEDAM